MRLHVSALLWFGLVVTAGLVDATTLNYAGVIKVTNSAFPSDIAVGDAFGFTFSYEDSVTDTNGSTVSGGFPGAFRAFTLTRHPGNLGVWDPTGGVFVFFDVLTFSAF